MNQNTSVDNDLQKAIDDITKSAGSDPLFADPVAAPAPVGPFPSASVTPAMPPNPPMPPSMPSMPANEPAPIPTPEEVTPAEPISAPAEDIKPTPIVHEDEPKASSTESGLGINQVKEAALRELAPIADKLNIPAEQKFSIYKDIIDNYHDSSIIEPAYRAASDIADDQARAEALLYIIDSIDHM